MDKTHGTVDRFATTLAMSSTASVAGALNHNALALSTSSTKPPALTQAKVRVPFKELSANIIADLLIDLCNEYGDVLTNLKLQLLLYYAQAWYLALYNKPLFQDRFEAWISGPIQPDVYAKFLPFTHRPIQQDTSNWDVPKRVSKHIVELMEAYGSMTAFDLSRLARQEHPWIEARGGLDVDEPSMTQLRIETMREYYRARLNEQEKPANSSDKA